MEARHEFPKNCGSSVCAAHRRFDFTGPAAANTNDQVPTRATLRVSDYNTATRTVPVYRSAGRPYYRARAGYAVRPAYVRPAYARPAVRPAYRYRAVRYGCPYGGCQLRY